MKKTVLLAFAVIGIAVVGCKPTTKSDTKTSEQTNTTKEIEDKCIAAVKAHITKMSEATGTSLDTLSLVKLDSATEKMAMLNFCRLTEYYKQTVDHFVKMQENVVEVSRAVTPMLAEEEMVRLNDAKAKQKAAEAELAKCLAEANAADSVNFVYYRVTTFGTRTSPHGKDTLTGPYFINKDFTIKLF